MPVPWAGPLSRPPARGRARRAGVPKSLAPPGFAIRENEPTFFLDCLADPDRRAPLVAAGRDAAARTGDRRLEEAFALPLPVRLAPLDFFFDPPVARLADVFRLDDVFDLAFPLPALPPLFFLAIGSAPILRWYLQPLLDIIRSSRRADSRKIAGPAHNDVVPGEPPLQQHRWNRGALILVLFGDGRAGCYVAKSIDGPV